MQFKKEDENYIYEIISKNIRKYRKLKGWTQQQLADKINYSLSFIRGIESSYHQTFSLGALWRISQALEVNFCKLCEDENTEKNVKYILYKCNKCGVENKIPLHIVRHFEEIYKFMGNNELPHFNCTNCDGEMYPVNPIQI